MGTFKIGIVLLPDENTELLLHALSYVARDMGNEVVLTTQRREGPRPHLSLFHMMVNMEGLAVVEGVINNLALPSAIGGVGFKRHVVDNNWLFLQAHGAGLLELQEQVVEAVAPLRTGDVEIKWTMSAAQQAAHAHYGYPNVGADAWDVHFTYGYITSAERVPQNLRDGIEMSQSWTARAIVIVRIGDHGTAAQILHQRDIPNLARQTT